MEITEIRVKFANREGDRLKAYCSVTFDEEFVVRDVRIVEGTNGLFVAMPSRKISVACPRCNHKNPTLAKFCSDCGAKLPAQPPAPESGPRTKLHRDIAHPITPAFRQTLHQRIIEAYQAECERAEDPDYQPKPMEEEEVETPEPVMEEPELREPEEQISEYDSLIADLRKGGGDAPRGDFDRPTRQPQSSGDRGRAPSRQQRPREGQFIRKPAAPARNQGEPARGQPEPARGLAPQQARPKPPRRAPAPASVPAAERAPRRPEAEPPPRREAAPPREVPTVVNRPRPADAPRPRQPVMAPVADEPEVDTQPFGAGLL